MMGWFKIIMTVDHPGIRGKPWKETETVEADDVTDAFRKAQDIIKRFNSTRVEGEKRRGLVSCEVQTGVEAGDMRIPHAWEKTNLVTIINTTGRMFDTAKCKHCGITARRYGLQGYTIDKKFEGRYFCDPKKRA